MDKVQDLFSEEELIELDDQFDPCAHGRKLRCDECASRDWAEGRKEGFELGFNWVMEEIGKRAGAAFVKHNDDEAKMLRRIVKEVTEHAIKEKMWIKPR